jgi:hypothetical protein
VFKKKLINYLVIHQHFGVYGIAPEVYCVKFFENWYSRGIEIEGSEFIKKLDLWKGTEIYILTILPWIKGNLTVEDLSIHVKIMADELAFNDKNIRLVTNNNVIRKPKSFWKK